MSVSWNCFAGRGTSSAQVVLQFPKGPSWKVLPAAPSRYEISGNKEDHTDPWATLICRWKSGAMVKRRPGGHWAACLCRGSGNDAHVGSPGFGPSIPKQLEDGCLFGGEESPHKVNGIFGQVRGDNWTWEFRTTTALQHLWTNSQHNTGLELKQNKESKECFLCICYILVTVVAV